MKKQLLIVMFFAVLFFYSSCAAGAQDAFKPELTKAFADAGLPLLKQRVAPQDFTLPILDPAVPLAPGATQSLSGLKGKVVFLNFWATWCGPCRNEMPTMESLYNRYKGKGFEILAVNSGERAQEVSAFMKNNKYTFPVVLDSDGAVSKTYGIQGIPTTYLVDKDGKIILRVVGSMNWDTPKIQAALEKLLSL